MQEDGLLLEECDHAWAYAQAEQPSWFASKSLVADGTVCWVAFSFEVGPDQVYYIGKLREPL